jgi:hypothetical protein
VALRKVIFRSKSTDFDEEQFKKNHMEREDTQDEGDKETNHMCVVVKIKLTF